jgi:hypothetical protein
MFYHFYCIGKNDYRLDLPPHLRIHDMLNVNNLKLFEPPLLEETVIVLHPVDNILVDKIQDRKAITTRQQIHVSYLVGRQGQTPPQAKLMTTETMQQQFPKLLTKEGMLSDLTGEEFDQ